MGKKSVQAQQPSPKREKPTTTKSNNTSKQSNNGIIRSDSLLMILAIIIALLSGLLYTAYQKNSSASIINSTSTSDDDKRIPSRSGQNYPIESDPLAAASADGATTEPTIPKGANVDGKPREVDKTCQDRHEECKTFQKNGECLKNPGWMIVNCPKSCNSVNNACTLRNPKLRCDRKFLNISTDPIYAPGDMNKMFESIETRFGSRYNPKVLSHDPWVILFENFISDEEGQALVSTIPRFERSTDTGSMNEIGEAGRVLSSGRTSSNGWCGDKCMKHPKVRAVLRRIEEVTGVPRQNYESFQVLKYEQNQKYNVHHDASPEDVRLACGPRILTFFLYLSDVEEGGETAFPKLNLAVKPKKGNAILWPSQLDSNPEEMDMRTFHEARPVVKGLKVAANAWIHLYNYEKPNLWGCTGSFDEL